jgi:ADP-ribosyl-[dinitrogen reductase] hydrolase
MNNTYSNAVLFGLAVGDALGVPVEFRSREELREEPVVTMIGYGSHDQPEGTWSDDSSLAFCLAEALTVDYDLARIGNNFVQWKNDAYWTAHGVVFDIGMTTHYAINRLSLGIQPNHAGSTDENSNGNGSLMRILPLLFHIKDKPIHERFEITRDVSSLTHGHIRSVIYCFFYLEFARQLLLTNDKFEAYEAARTLTVTFLTSLPSYEDEMQHFDRLLNRYIHHFDEDSISSEGYVVSTLEASMYCLLTTDSYSDAVLKAVNLGAEPIPPGQLQVE